MSYEPQLTLVFDPEDGVWHASCETGVQASGPNAEAVLGRLIVDLASRLVSAEGRAKRAEGQLADLDLRKRKTKEKLAQAEELTRQAEGWQRQAQAKAMENTILRGQLEQHGIEVDPRCR